MNLDFKPLDDTRCSLGEGPVYDDRREALIWCDIVERAVHAYFFNEARTQTWTFRSEVGSLGLAESGRLVVALRSEVGLFDPESGVFERIAEIEAENPDTRLNDGKVGPDGAFWVGTMDDRDVPRKDPLGALYRVEASGRVDARSTAWWSRTGWPSPPTAAPCFIRIRAADGSIAGTSIRPPAIFPGASASPCSTTRPGVPTAARPMSTGAYWSAGVSAARLNRFSPEGELLDSYPVPVAAPTMPCFGGPGLDKLFVTSLRAGRAPELLDRYPLTGITIVADSPVPGSPVSRFADI